MPFLQQAASPTLVRIPLQAMEETEGIADTVEAVSHPSDAIDELLLSEDMVEGLVGGCRTGARQRRVADLGEARKVGQHAVGQPSLRRLSMLRTIPIAGSPWAP